MIIEKNKKYVICDVDGTVADNNHRQHLLGKSRNWEAFFNEMENDQPIKNVLEMVKKKYENGFQIIFLTGRPEKYRSITKKWLEKYIYFEFDLEDVKTLFNSNWNIQSVEQMSYISGSGKGRKTMKEILIYNY